LIAIDIYSGTNIKSWPEVKASGVQAVYIKLTDGLTYINPDAANQIAGAKAVGLEVGPYHFAERNGAAEEYNHFRSVANRYKWDLKPSLDYEVSSPDFNYINTFLAKDINLLLYGDHAVLDRVNIALTRKWIAEPGTRPGNTRGYAGIQDSWKARIPGINNSAVDEDLFDNSVLLNGVVIKEAIMSVTMIPIKQGENSKRVSIIQGILNTILGLTLKTDGDYGPISVGAVKEYQSILKLTMDGEVGSLTLTTLFDDLKANWFGLK
jgi:lysozyme